MGMTERIGEWLHRQREKVLQRRARMATARFKKIVEGRLEEPEQVWQAVRKYGNYPEITKRQAELLLENRIFRFSDETGQCELREVMKALRDTRYGEQTRQEAFLPIEEREKNPLALLDAHFKVLDYERRRMKKPSDVLDAVELADRQAAHRLLNHYRRESDLAALKELAMKGTRPEESVIIRYGLADDYRQLARLRYQWNQEQSHKEYQAMDVAEDRISAQQGRLMRGASEIYEKEMQGKLPEDYTRMLHEDRKLLKALAKNGWHNGPDVPKEAGLRYGLAGDFAEIARGIFKYSVGLDCGNPYAEYPHDLIDCRSRSIQKQAAKELKILEDRLFPERKVMRKQQRQFKQEKFHQFQEKEANRKICQQHTKKIRI